MSRLARNIEWRSLNTVDPKMRRKWSLIGVFAVFVLVPWGGIYHFLSLGEVPMFIASPSQRINFPEHAFPRYESTFCIYPNLHIDDVKLT